MELVKNQIFKIKNIEKNRHSLNSMGIRIGSSIEVMRTNLFNMNYVLLVDKQNLVGIRKKDIKNISFE